MEEKKHQKHSKIKRPAYGYFARNEWAILGTTCGNIQNLAKTVIEQLDYSDHKWKTAYVDADHQSDDNKSDAANSCLALGATMEYVDKINFHRFDTKAKLESYQYRTYFNEMDLVLINGNHFLAKKQIVVIDSKKLESLSRKLDRLTDVALIIMTEGEDEIPDFLANHLPKNKEIPQIRIHDTEQLLKLFTNSIDQSIPPIYGLVLAGGKSQRMGQDKGLINYHGKSQREHMADLLSGVCNKTFLSCRPDQLKEINSQYTLIGDRFMELGPYGAILSAFLQEPEVAWLVVACDLPLLDKAAIENLIHRRNSSKIASAYQSPVNEFPEPLVAIWEPKAYPIALQFLAQGYSCPRKVLINNDVELIKMNDPNKLLNVNRPEELDQIKTMI